MKELNVTSQADYTLEVSKDFADRSKLTLHTFLTDEQMREFNALVTSLSFRETYPIGCRRYYDDGQNIEAPGVVHALLQSFFGVLRSKASRAEASSAEAICTLNPASNTADFPGNFIVGVHDDEMFTVT